MARPGQSVLYDPTLDAGILRLMPVSYSPLALEVVIRASRRPVTGRPEGCSALLVHKPSTILFRQRACRHEGSVTARVIHS